MRANMGEVGEAPLDDLEGLLREITEFCAAINNKPEDIPQSLERYLNYVARSGNTVFPWQHVRPLFRTKILQSMSQFPEEVCPNNESFVLERFDLFRAAPFTIQRLSELITQPTRHYKKKEKFIRGLEKTVLVVSTVEPWSVDNDIRNGNDSGSDGEMDQTYSESDDSSANRTFTMDRVMHEGGDHLGLLGSSTEAKLQSVTTTMINITSNGNQSTTTIGSTSTSSSLAEEIISSHVMSSSELGLSEVITSGDNSDNLIRQNASNLLPSNLDQVAVGEPVPTILGQGCESLLVAPEDIQNIAAEFEPVTTAEEQIEGQNHQISSNLIAVNIEQLPASTEPLASASDPVVSEIIEHIQKVSEGAVTMDLEDVPVIPATGEDNSIASATDLVGQVEQLVSEESVIQAVNEEVKQDLTPPVAETSTLDAAETLQVVEPVDVTPVPLEVPPAFEANVNMAVDEIPAETEGLKESEPGAGEDVPVDVDPTPVESIPDQNQGGDVPNIAPEGITTDAETNAS